MMGHALAVLQADVEARDGTPDAAAVLLLDAFEDAAMDDPKLIVHRDPEILGGTPVFVGTRVPVRILFDYLEAGDSLEVFLGEFPSVTREQAVAALELAREVIAPDAHPA
jgi:uncharacterized protein (DUF433 family)